METITMAEAMAIVNKKRAFEDGEKYLASTLKNQSPKRGTVFLYCEYKIKEETKHGRDATISIVKALIV